MSWSLVLLETLLWGAVIVCITCTKMPKRNRFVRSGRILPPPSPNTQRNSTEAVTK